MNQLKVLGLSYYDGVTEGFFDDVNDSNVYFFKVVAWDQNQDKRLYLLSKIGRCYYAEILDLLATIQPRPDEPTWLPFWKFQNSENTQRANEIVGIGERSLNTPDFISLGDDVVSAVKIDNPSIRAFENAIVLAEKSDPGDLDVWLLDEQ